MPTQIIELDLDMLPDVIRVRDDVGAVLLVATRRGRPVHITRMPRPIDGVLAPKAIADCRGVPHDERPDDRALPTSVSVVIPTHERPEDLARCLESLVDVAEAGHEVVVVDNAPTSDRTRAVVARFDVRYVKESIPGANRARNAGFNAATHDVIAFVDDDVVVSAAWVTAIGTCFMNPAVGGATGLVLPLELETVAQEQFELYAQHRRDLQSRTFSRHTLAPSAAGVVGIGANMAVRRSVLSALGGFDDRFGPGTATRTGDETELFARILDAGYTILYEPGAYVWHRHRRTSREVRACVFGYGVGLYSMLTKRVVENGDLGALNTAVRWWIGPVVKAARAKLEGRPAPPWSVVLSETSGALIGPFCFGLETFRSHAGT